MPTSSKKRLRVFAGPNGSGKSTITKIVLDYVHLGTYVNADELKVILSKKRFLDCSSYGITVERNHFISALQSSSLVNKIGDVNYTLSQIVIEENIIRLNDNYEIEDYFVSFITSYIWNALLDVSKKFTVETVMSHSSKLDFMRLAQEKGFKIYLYFVALADPELNKHRVKTRVAQGGHPVDEQKIQSRYYKTMGNLYEALKIADSAFLFDNSFGEPNMFAVKEKGMVNIISNYVPKWFEKYVIDIVEGNDSKT